MQWHKSLETIVLTMAAFGAWVFVVPDYMDGECLNMQPIGVAECAPPLTPFYFFFVYFGVTINLIWLVVPVAMLVHRVRSEMPRRRAAAASSAPARSKSPARKSERKRR